MAATASAAHAHNCGIADLFKSIVERLDLIGEIGAMVTRNCFRQEAIGLAEEESDRYGSVGQLSRAAGPARAGILLGEAR
jgi:hypothetical protein